MTGPRKTHPARSTAAGVTRTGIEPAEFSEWAGGPQLRFHLPYDVPDFRPVADLDGRLPRWLRFEAEERFRYEGYENSGFRRGNDDSYLLNRFRFQADVQFGSWFRFVSQVQDARPIQEKPPIGPPNENRWDLKLAYVSWAIRGRTGSACGWGAS